MLSNIGPCSISLQAILCFLIGSCSICLQAMLCYWFTSNAFSLVQVLFLKIPAIRTFFQIPDLVDHSTVKIRELPAAPKKTFMEGFRESKPSF